MSTPLRGQVYRADIGFGPKPWLVVSDNHRDRALSDLHRDELHDLLGSLSPTTLRAVNNALRIVLALP